MKKVKGFRILSWDEVVALHINGKLVGCFLLFPDNTKQEITIFHTWYAIKCHHITGGLIGKEIEEEMEDIFHYVPAEQEKSYKDGLNDAWELAQKLMCYPAQGGWDSQELETIFGSKSPMTIMMSMSPQEILSKLEAYERSMEEIKVGDIVETSNGKGIVSKIVGDTYEVLFSKNIAYARKCLKKTGENVDISPIFAKL